MKQLKILIIDDSKRVVFELKTFFKDQGYCTFYDGYQFTVYRNNPEEPDSLSNNFVHAICEDKNRNLWIGTDKGLNRFNIETKIFTRYFHTLSYNRINYIYEDSDKTLWIGTHGGGLNAFDQETEKFINYSYDPKNPESLSDNHIYYIYESQDKILWISTYEGGLNAFNKQEKKFKRYLPNLENSQYQRFQKYQP